MSIPVDLDRLAETLSEYGPGYLLTASADGRVKAVTVEPNVGDGVLVVDGPGRGTLANLASNPALTLLFPPPVERGYTLLIDGTGSVAGDQVTVTPSGGVLHRPAAHADGPLPPEGCGHDCAPIDGSTE